jgi:hypothetical protein
VDLVSADAKDVLAALDAHVATVELLLAPVECNGSRRRRRRLSVLNNNKQTKPNKY